MYAFGIILYELISRKEPYSEINQRFDDILPLVANPGLGNQVVRPEIPPECPKELSDMMQECWSHTPAERPTFERLAQRARVLDLTTIGMGRDAVQELFDDMYPKHVSCIHACMHIHTHA